LVGWTKVWDRVQVVHARGVEKVRQIDGVLSGVHGDLYDPVCHNRNRTFRIAARPPQRKPSRVPGALIRAELLPLALEVLGNRVDGDGLVPARASPLGVVARRRGRGLVG
jgi:hypothetical protein